MFVAIEKPGVLVMAKRGVDGDWMDGSMSFEDAFKAHGVWVSSYEDIRDTKTAGVQTLDFQGGGLRDATVGKLAHILSHNTTISTLNLAWNLVSDPGATRVATTLRTTVSLRNLDLTHNDIGDAGFTELAAALGGEQDKLSLIGLTVNRAPSQARSPRSRGGQLSRFGSAASGGVAGGDGEESMKHRLKEYEMGQVLKEFTRVPSKGPTLTRKTSNPAQLSKLPPEINSCLQSLHLSHNLASSRGVLAILDALGRHVSLTSLSLAALPIGIEAKSLAKALRGTTRLQTLDLSATKIDAKAVTAIAEALTPPWSPSLTSLNFARNSVGDEGAAALAKALLPTACEVDADGVPIRVEDSAGKPLNHDHSDRMLLITEVRGFGTEKCQGNLRSLDLQGNGIGAAGVKSLAKALERNTNLQSLVLSGNKVLDAGADAMATSIKKNTTLTSLFFHDGTIGLQGVTRFSEALSSAPHLDSTDAIFRLGTTSGRGGRGSLDMSSLSSTNASELFSPRTLSLMRMDPPTSLERLVHDAKEPLGSTGGAGFADPPRESDDLPPA